MKKGNRARKDTIHVFNVGESIGITDEQTLHAITKSTSHLTATTKSSVAISSI